MAVDFYGMSDNQVKTWIYKNAETKVEEELMGRTVDYIKGIYRRIFRCNPRTALRKFEIVRAICFWARDMRRTTALLESEPGFLVDLPEDL